MYLAKSLREPEIDGILIIGERTRRLTEEKLEKHSPSKLDGLYRNSIRNGTGYIVFLAQ